MTHTVELLPAAVRQLKKLPAKAQKQIKTVIDGLASNPRPRGYKPLQGPLKGYFRIDTGDYRVIYEIRDKQPSGSRRKSRRPEGNLPLVM